MKQNQVPRDDSPKEQSHENKMVKGCVGECIVACLGIGEVDGVDGPLVEMHTLRWGGGDLIVLGKALNARRIARIINCHYA